MQKTTRRKQRGPKARLAKLAARRSEEEGEVMDERCVRGCHYGCACDDDEYFYLRAAARALCERLRVNQQRFFNTTGVWPWAKELAALEGLVGKGEK